MKYSLNNMIKFVLLCVALVSLTACFHSEDDSEVDLSGVTTEQAQATMITTVFNGFSGGLENVDSVIFDSDALTAITENPEIASLLGDDATTLQQATSISDIVDIGTLLGDDADSDLQALFPTEGMTDQQYAAQIDQLMGAYFNEPIRVGNTISYTLNSQLCTADTTLTAEEIAQCTILLSVVSIEQTLISETSGTVDLMVNASTPISIGYSETEIYVEVDLGAIKTALVTLGPVLASSEEDSIVLPETFAGAIRLSLGAPDINSASIQLGVTKAIDIDGSIEGLMLDANIAQSPELLVFTATETTIGLTLDLKTTSIIIDDTLTITDPTATPEVIQINTGGIKANVSMGPTGDIVIRDTGITDSLSVKIAESESALINADPMALITLADFDATVSSDFSSISLGTDFDLGVSIDLFDQAVAFSIAADANTDINIITTEGGSMIPKVLTGSLTLTGVGADAVPSSATATDSECLGESTSTGGFFLYEVVTCPVAP